MNDNIIKEFDEICDMFNNYIMRGYRKDGVIRFLAELTQKLCENGIVYMVESFDGEISVKEVMVDGQKIKEIQAKLDEAIESERSLCEEVEKLEAEKRENRNKMFPYENIERMKEEIKALNDRHQSDCIEKMQLHTALDVMIKKYQKLRNIHGLCGKVKKQEINGKEDLENISISCF